eukprot:SAG31_NODE_4442_length_3226_cov_3.664535_2_plen_200_part_00
MQPAGPNSREPKRGELDAGKRQSGGDRAEVRLGGDSVGASVGAEPEDGSEPSSTQNADCASISEKKTRASSLRWHRLLHDPPANPKATLAGQLRKRLGLQSTPLVIATASPKFGSHSFMILPKCAQDAQILAETDEVLLHGQPTLMTSSVLDIPLFGPRDHKCATTTLFAGGMERSESQWRDRLVSSAPLPLSDSSQNL